MSMEMPILGPVERLERGTLTERGEKGTTQKPHDFPWSRPARFAWRGLPRQELDTLARTDVVRVRLVGYGPGFCLRVPQWLGGF